MSRSRLRAPLRLACVTVMLTLGACSDQDLDLAGVVERPVLELSAPRSELVVELPIELGGTVVEGQIVAQLDTRVGEAELRAREAALEAAQAALVEAEGAFARQSKLRTSRVATQQALDAARRQRDEALALVAENQARITRATKEVEDLTMRSPASGVLDQLPFDMGERVPAGGVVAVVLADGDPWVRVWMPSRAVAQSGLGASAEVTIEGYDETFNGRVSYVAHQSEFTPHFALTERESAHLVYATRVTLENAPKGLRPGLAARVRLERSAGGGAE